METNNKVKTPIQENTFKKWFKEHIFKSKKNCIISSALLAGAVLLTVLTGIAFGKFSKYQPYFYGKEEGNNNVTKVEKFSKYSPSLEGTPGDADIYILEGQEKGPGILILGGTHPNEPSGQLTATLLLENLKVNKGTVYIITETNRSAFTHSYPQEASPFYYTLTTASGAKRTFKFGSRATNTNDQWPNPDVYVHEYSGQKLSTSETRNLNRAYPGVVDGTYTERVAYAVSELVRQNDIAVTIDLHEASPEYLTINAAVCHQRSRKVYNKANDDLNDNIFEGCIEQGLTAEEARTRDIHGEDSPMQMHGLTHRELGDHTNTLSILFETSNAAQGKYRGAFTEELITYGEENPNYAGDPFYERSVMLDDGNEGTKNGILYARPVALSERVARHAESIYQTIKAYNKIYTNIDLYDNREVETAVTLKTEDAINACHEARVEQGEFDIDFSSIYDKTIYGSLYASICYNKVGYFLHDPTSNN